MRLIAVLAGLLFLDAAAGTSLRAQEMQVSSSRKIVSKAMPVYPELARKMHLEGTVKLQVTVAPGGAAKNIDVVGGNPVLARAAEDAVAKFRWTPAAEESKELVEFRFRYGDSE
jgi:TonB family protein